MKAKIRRFIVYILSETIGSLFILLDPKKADELAKAGMTVQMQHLNLTFKERLMRKAILRTTKRKREFDLLAEFHQNYWKKKGADFFSETQSRLVNNYLPNCEFVFEILRKQLVKESDQFHTLVEIGTGNGIVLNYLSQGFTQFKKLIGIDLSDVQIQKNIEKYSENPRLEFETGDAFHWIDTHKNDYTCFLTFHGVLEYFTEERLQIFLNKISASGKVIFLAVEPVALDHDFSKNPHSQVYGPEYSFSHNYPLLFKNAGFELWHHSKTKEENTPFSLNIIGAKN